MSEIIMDDVCRNNHKGNSESEAANAATQKKRDSAKVYDFIRNSNFMGTTCDNIEVELAMRHQTASARCSELLRDGSVVRNKERRLTRSGSTAAVLIASVHQAEQQEARS